MLLGSPPSLTVWLHDTHDFVQLRQSTNRLHFAIGMGMLSANLTDPNFRSARSLRRYPASRSRPKWNRARRSKETSSCHRARFRIHELSVGDPMKIENKKNPPSVLTETGCRDWYLPFARVEEMILGINSHQSYLEMRTSSSSSQRSRRDFIRQSLHTAAVAGAFPFILNPKDKAGAKRPRVGKGNYVYECYHDWGADNLPSGHHYGGASHGVAVDSQGLIYITHHGGPDSIFVFDPEGHFVRSFGAHQRTIDSKTSESTGRGHGIDIRQEPDGEFIYLAPNHVSLFFSKTTLEGDLVWHRDRQAMQEETSLFANPGRRFRPTNTSFRPDGGYYLGDGYGSNYLFQYTRDDQFVRAIGGPGKADGQFQTPHGQCLDDRDGTSKLVVADRANKRLQWFDMDGQHLRTQGGFLFPADIDTQGELMLVPDLHARVTLLDRDNRVIDHLGDDETWRTRVLSNNFALRSQRPQWQPGRFVHPHDACFDSDGNIFVAEWVVTGRVTKLVRV